MDYPDVRKIKIRLEGDDQDAVTVAEMLANLLPAMSQGRYQVGEISKSYPNRREPGARRYVDVYLLTAEQSQAEGYSPPARGRHRQQIPGDTIALGPGSVGQPG